MAYSKINHTRFTLSVLLFLTSILFFSSCNDSKNNNKNSSEVSKPNIIFVLVDDMGWGDVGAFYQNQRKKADDPAKPWQSTPQLDKMAGDGAMLTNHYSAAPVCAPSRASLMLGVTQGHSNVRDNQFDKAIAANYTMASTLKKLGYNTAAIGKWGLQGNDKFDKNGDEWPARPRKRGFDYFLGYMRHIDGHEHYPKEALYSENSKQVWRNDSVITKELDKSYTADLWTASAKKWIIDHEKGKNKKNPFFMYLAYDTPHAVIELPTQAYPSGGGVDGGIQWLGKPGHMINTASGKADSWIHPDYANATYDDDNDSSTPEVPWPDVYKRYATAVRRIDSGVGDLRKLLSDLGIAKNTIIVFSSDNGPSRESYLNHSQRKVNKNKHFKPNAPTFFDSFGPFDGIKRDTWEGGMREPTIAVWPGHIPAGKVVDDPSSQYDWLSTFTNAAGMPAPSNSDGVSLLPTLTGKGTQQDGLVYVEYYHHGVTPNYKEFAPRRRGERRKQMQMIRMGKYVGVRYNIKSASDDFEIYDVSKDPGERNNLADNPERPPSIKELEQKMKNKVLQVRMPNKSAPRPYDDVLIPSVENAPKTEQGLHWKAYDGEYPWVPQIAGLTPRDEGTAKTLSDNPDSEKYKVVAYNGYLDIPKDGTYTFYLNTTEKAVMRVHEATVIDADEGEEKQGTLKLEKGLHPLKLTVLQENKGSSQLALQWKGPNGQKQEIPAKIFRRK